MAFLPGTSGNPAGRAKGSKNRANSLIRDALPETLSQVIQQAKAGDLTACGLLLRHGVPPLRASHEVTAIVKNAADLTPSQLARAVTTSVMEGRLAADVAQAILAGLQAQVGIIESTELAERVAELEAQAEQHSGGRRW